MQRRTFLTVTLLSTIGSPARAATRGGTLVYGRQTDCIYLDPVHTAQNADIWVSLNLYDTLTQPTNDGKSVVPGLASSWETSQDGKVMTFKLRPNLRFADGSPLTVDDVKWSLERAANKETGGEFQFLLASIEGVETQGTDSVILRLKHPDPTMLQALATFNAGIVPSKLIMAEPGTTLDDKSKSFAQHPVGSGPFTLKSWSRNSEMVMTRNPYYWKLGSDGQPLPYLDEVRYVIIPDDATRILKLKAGEIDAAEFIPYSRVAELKADPRLNMVLFPAAQVHYFTMNNRPTLKDGTKNPLSDLRVRQALNYATDKQALIQVVTYGIGTPEQSFMPMSTPLSYGNGPLYPYDLEQGQGTARPVRLGAWLRNHPVHHRRQRGRCRQGDSTATDVGAARGAPEGRADGIGHADCAVQRRRLPDADLAVDQRHQRSERDHLAVLLLPHHPESPLRLGRSGDRPAVPGQPAGA